MGAALVAVRVTNLSKTFRKGQKALDDVNLTLGEGEMVALIGASGSGKSTLIRHIAGLVNGDKKSGQISVFESSIQAGGRIAKGVRRTRRHIGVVFQQFNLVGRLPVLTNVLIGVLGVAPIWRTWLGIFTREEKLSAMAALARVGIADHARNRASTLSGGQQQRAAIARTITQHARLILADEPIASLDPASARTVMETLAAVNREDGVTVLVSLHQVDYAIEFCPRTIAMRDGKVIFDGPSTKLTPEFLKELYGAEGLGHVEGDAHAGRAADKALQQQSTGKVPVQAPLTAH